MKTLKRNRLDHQESLELQAMTAEEQKQARGGQWWVPFNFTRTHTYTHLGDFGGPVLPPESYGYREPYLKG